MNEQIHVLARVPLQRQNPRDDHRCVKSPDCVFRRYYIGFSVTMFILCTVIVTLICLAGPTRTTAQKQMFTTNCHPGTFPCESDGSCLNITLMCDYHPDCPDGTDEGAICDNDMNNVFSFFYVKPHDSDMENSSTDCSLQNVPISCQCRESTKLYCENRSLVTVPPGLPDHTTCLDLSFNDLSDINLEHFKSMAYLENLTIGHSYVKSIAAGTFTHSPKLRKLDLKFNFLTRFSSDIFLPATVLTELNLKGNLLTELRGGDFADMSNLKIIHLSENKIYSIQENSFHNLPSLEILDLRRNFLTEILPHFFMNLTSLKYLYLSENKISRVFPGSFVTLHNLQSVDLTRNSIQVLNNGVFDGLQNLSLLLLARNDISVIEKLVFKDLVNVKSIDLTSNLMTRIENGTFSYSRALEFIYFDKFYMCLYARQARVCEPQGDGISSKYNLLGNILLRVCVWLVALLACGGNLMVIMGRFLMREDNQIHSFFIKNLGLADLLMGLYLLMIAANDIRFRGDYIMYDELWRHSWECDLCGFLSTLSTEVSVLTLSVITIDRYISIMYPLSFRKRGLKVAYCVMTFTWIICILLAALPLTGIQYFGLDFYSDNAVCVPLHLHEPKARGWEYSSFLFLGINFGSFTFIAYAYVAMFWAIHKSTLSLRTSRECQERSLVKRFFFIVITDFMCWIPIIIIKILALSGFDISRDLDAWIVVFALPVNSALNPLLYTLTTNMFKKKFLSKFAIIRNCFRSDPSKPPSSVKDTCLIRQMQECEIRLLQRYRPCPLRCTDQTSTSSMNSRRHRGRQQDTEVTSVMGTGEITSPRLLSEGSTDLCTGETFFTGES